MEDKKKIQLEVLLEILRKIDKQMKQKVNVYILGGGALILSHYKTATKDIDIVMDNMDELRVFIDTLEGMGYSQFESPVLNDRTRAYAFFLRNKEEIRFDIFINKIASKIAFSESMKERSIMVMLLSKINLYRLSNEDIFFLKSASGRDRDLDDLSALFNAKLDWDVILSECRQQRKLTGRVWSVIMLETLNDLEEQYKLTCKKRKDFERLAEEDLKALIKRRR